MAKTFKPASNSNRTASMPGINDNLSNAKDIQAFIKSQIYMMGFNLPMNSGPNPENKIQLSGSARRLFGFVLFVSQANVNDDDTFTLTINNEMIVNKCLWRAFNPTSAGNFKTQMFFATPRPLSGSDAINIAWTATNAKTVFPTFYLSDSES